MSNVIELLSELLSFNFMVKALIVGLSISISSSILGIGIVFKRHSMIGDGLSHVAFGALSLSFLLKQSPLIFSTPIIIIAAFIILRIDANSKVKSDAAIAIISSTSLSLGIIINSMSKSGGSNIQQLMFGSILAINMEDVYLGVIISIIVIILFIYFYNKIFLITFDENFATATGTNISHCNNITALMTALTISIGMRIMGAMLISSLFVFPCVISSILSKNFKQVVISSILISIITFFSGLVLSYAYDMPTGATIVLIYSVLFIFSYIIKSLFKK